MRRSVLLWFGCLLMGVQAADLRVTKPGRAGFDRDRLSRISEMIKGCVDRGEVPGAVALLAKNGRIGYYRAFGWADVESEKKLRRTSLFRIASMSKLVTSVAALQLFERGLFDMNTPLGDVLPEFSNAAVFQGWDGANQSFISEPAKQPIRFRHLFTHTSGIVYPVFTSDGRQGYLRAKVFDAFPDGQISLEENIKRLASVPLAHEPGEGYTYGMNMDVLGRVIEVLDGRPFARYMREEIFQPLKMTDTGFRVDPSDEGRVVTAYTTVDGEMELFDDEVMEQRLPNNKREWWKRNPDLAAMGGAGIVSSAYDYARFLQMLVNGGELEGVSILGRKTVEMISRGLDQRDPHGSTAMGLSVGVVTDASKHFHPESEGTYNWGGYFYTSFWVDPKEKLVGVLMSQINPVESRMSGQFKIMAYSAIR